MGSPNGRKVEEREYLNNRPKYKARRTLEALGGRILCRSQLVCDSAKVCSWLDCMKLVYTILTEHPYCGAIGF